MQLAKEKGVPKHSQIHLNPKINPKNTGLKWSVMINPCASVLSVFHFRPVSIAEGWWTPLLTDIFIPCCRCVPSLQQGHKSKKETRIPRTWHGSVFHGSFFWFYFGQRCLDLGLIYLDLRVPGRSLFLCLNCCFLDVFCLKNHQPILPTDVF